MQTLESTAAVDLEPDNDLGPLAWVLDELRKSLESAVKSLRRFVRESETSRGVDLAALDASQLRVARQQLHQALGALEMVGLAQPARLLRAMETATQNFVLRPELCNDDAAAKIERASFALVEYLENVLAGKSVSPVALFPQYRDVQELVGAEKVHPADLWVPERRAADPSVPAAAQALAYAPAVRSRLDQAVLRIVKTGDPAAARDIHQIALGLAAGEANKAAATFWKVCAGFFEALGQGLLPADVYVKRLASRILLQYTTLARGDTSITERLLQDLLFFCAQAQPAAADVAPALAAVREAYGLARHAPVDYESRRFGRFDPAMLVQARKRIASATETWSALAGGDTHKLKAAADQFNLVCDSLQKLQPESGELARALMQAVESTARSGQPPAAPLAMEVATAVLYLQAAYEDLDPSDAQMAGRAARLAERLDRVRAGGESEPLETWMEELYSRVSDRQTMGSVVEELRATLGEVEKSLDQYFRDTQDKAALAGVPSQLAQMRGVLSVLGLDQASHAVMRMRDSVDRFLVDGSPDEAHRATTFEKLGNSLGALGFLVDMLNYQRALAKKLFVYDEEQGELKVLMGRKAPAPTTDMAPDVVAAPLAAAPAPVSAPAPAPSSSPAPAAFDTTITLPTPAAPPAPVAPAAPAPAAGAGEAGIEDEELRDIFLEEAREVVQTGLASIAALRDEASNLTEQTTLRRAFHTLKGSSRMVGLSEFGEAAWSMEQLFNAWLAEQKPVDAPLLALAQDALKAQGRWVEDLAANAAAGWSAAPFRASADAMRLERRSLPLAVPGTAAPADAGAPSAAPAADALAAIDQFPTPEIDEQDRLGFESTQIIPDSVEPRAVESASTPATLDIGELDFGSAPAPAAPHDVPTDPAAAAALPAVEWDLDLSLDGAQVEVIEAAELPPEAPLDAKESFGLAPADVGDVVEVADAADVTDPEATQAFTVSDAPAGPAAALPVLEEAVSAFAALDAQLASPVPAVVEEAEAQPLAAPEPSAESEAGPPGEAAEEPAPAAEEPVVDQPAIAEPVVEEPAAVPAAVEAAEPERDDMVKVIGSLRIGIPLYNVYLNEADEWSRRLLTEATEWSLELHQPVPDSTVALAHSLAGSSATVGFQALSDMARMFEHALQHVQLQPRGTPEQAKAFINAAEDVRRLLHQFAAGFLKEPDPGVVQGLREVLESEAVTLTPEETEEALEAALQPVEPPPEVVVPHGPISEPARTLVAEDNTAPADTGLDDDIDVIDVIDPDLFPIFEEEALELLPQLGGALRQWHARPENESARGEVLRALHTLKGSARLAGALRLGELAHRMESAIEHLDTHAPSPSLLEPLVVRFDALQENFDNLRAVDAQAQSQPEATGNVLPLPELTDAALAQASAPAAAPAQAAAPAVRAPIRVPVTQVLAPLRQASNQSVRVRSQLLDRLVNQAGEVMISRSRLEEHVGQLRGSLAELTGNLDRLRHQLRDIELQAETQMQSRLALARDSAAGFDPLEFDRFTRVQELTRMMAESVNDVATVQRNLQRSVEGAEDDLLAQGRQSRELQRDLLRIRMVEFEGISERLYAVVRQAAKDAGKQVKLDITGGAIEMDRGVLDRMTPAFEHLLRNAVAHGIEDPAVRGAAGKSAAGTITIGLHHEGNDVSVEFRDDGAGLNLQRIREKAVAQGLAPAGTEISDAEAANLIFMPGFSTASSVTELAGRGIGMDVVRSEVTALGGRIETSSVPGQGTAFKMVLPLTTAVTQVVMLRAGELSIGVPASIVEIVRRTPMADLEEAYRSGVFHYGGEDIPFYWAGALLQSSARSTEPAAKACPVILFRSAAQRLAVHVDEVLGNQEVVVKNLGPQLSRLPGLAGMSVLASGAVVLVYNPVALATIYGEQARQRSQSAAPAVTATVADVPAQPVAPAAVPNQIPLVLVVDDSITVRRVTQRLLHREGYRVALAADGLQALERLQEELPAVVLSDIEMPRMDGFDLARNIRGDAQMKDLPIIMITSRIAEKHREHAKELGVDHYLGKPYSEEELLSLVRRYTSAQVAAE